MKVTSLKLFIFNETKETVKLEVSDTKHGFAVRLVVGKFSTTWNKYYEGIHGIASPTHTDIYYIYLSQYWNGALPTEQVLMVKKANSVYPIT